MDTNNNKEIECKCEEDHNGNCYFCGRNMLSSPLTMEERFDEQCDAVCSVCKSGIKVFIRQEISSAVSQALEEERQFILNVLDGIDEADRQMNNTGGGTLAIRHALQSRIIK